MTRTRNLSIEAPDTKAVVDFFGDHGCTVTTEITINAAGNPEVYVIVKSHDQVATILGEIVAEIPPSDLES